MYTDKRYCSHTHSRTQSQNIKERNTWQKIEGKKSAESQCSHNVMINGTTWSNKQVISNKIQKCLRTAFADKFHTHFQQWPATTEQPATAAERMRTASPAWTCWQRTLHRPPHRVHSFRSRVSICLKTTLLHTLKHPQTSDQTCHRFVLLMSRRHLAIH